jgi:hypothetical protein
VFNSHLLAIGPLVMSASTAPSNCSSRRSILDPFHAKFS